MMRWATFLGLAGLLLAIGLFVGQGVAEVAAAFLAGGIGLIWASLFHIVPMAVNARAWHVLLPPRRRPGLAFFLWLVWVREAVNGLLPVARIGGEVVSARLMRLGGLPTSQAVASLVVDVTLSLASQFLFTIIGIGLLLALSGDIDLGLRLTLALLLTVPFVIVLIAVQRRGLFELMGRLFNMLFRERWSTLIGATARIDRAVRHLYRRRAWLMRCLAWQLLGWILGAGEIWLALRYLGHPVGVAEAIVLEALAQAVSSAAFMVPAALGVQEGGFLVFGGILGLGPEIGLALALARRLRDIVVFVPALLAWQYVEGKRWWLSDGVRR
ncbi:MAG: flippase-like domain-containing protein [Proteobacteria bacterium]|nr:flippase-like domain-containing protein [Pseudomonadota bacterium]MBI3499070.1 flippase-like domain-containing protein [Pseudomonadota bacterium]